MEHLERTHLLLGAGAMDALARARVIVFGVGGVGSWCAEALARVGVGEITVVDSDLRTLTSPFPKTTSQTNMLRDGRMHSEKLTPTKTGTWLLKLQ